MSSGTTMNRHTYLQIEDLTEPSRGDGKHRRNQPKFVWNPDLTWFGIEKPAPVVPAPRPTLAGFEFFLGNLK